MKCFRKSVLCADEFFWSISGHPYEDWSSFRSTLEMEITSSWMISVPGKEKIYSVIRKWIPLDYFMIMRLSIDVIFWRCVFSSSRLQVNRNFNIQCACLIYIVWNILILYLPFVRIRDWCLIFGGGQCYRTQIVIFIRACY